MTRLTLHYPKDRSLAVTFHYSLQTAMGYKQGFVQPAEFTEDQITVDSGFFSALTRSYLRRAISPSSGFF
jgi:hypothetical protein